MTRPALLPVLLFAAGSLAWGHAPYSWGHHLTQACEWVPRGALGFLGGAEDEHSRWLRMSCRGAKSPSPEIKVFLTRWPTPAELAAWRDQ